MWLAATISDNSDYGTFPAFQNVLLDSACRIEGRESMNSRQGKRNSKMGGASSSKINFLDFPILPRTSLKWRMD